MPSYVDLERNSTAIELASIVGDSWITESGSIIISEYGLGRSVYFPYCIAPWIPETQIWETDEGQILTQIFI